MPANKCKYYNVCPSATGWCLNRQPDVECAGLIIGMYCRLKEQKPVLIVKPAIIMRENERKALHQKIAEQVPTGVVVLPYYCDVEYAPPNVNVKVEVYDHGLV